MLLAWKLSSVYLRFLNGLCNARTIRLHHRNTPHPPRLSAFPRPENTKGASPAISLLNLCEVSPDLAFSMTAGKSNTLKLEVSVTACSDHKRFVCCMFAAVDYRSASAVPVVTSTPVASPS